MNQLLITRISKYHVIALWYPRISSKDILYNIFSKIHRLASHSTKTHELRWKQPEQRLINRFRKRI